jgi:hypothetical protein
MEAQINTHFSVLKAASILVDQRKGGTIPICCLGEEHQNCSCFKSDVTGKSHTVASWSALGAKLVTDRLWLK